MLTSVAEASTYSVLYCAVHATYKDGFAILSQVMYQLKTEADNIVQKILVFNLPCLFRPSPRSADYACIFLSLVLSIVQLKKKNPPKAHSS